MAESFLGEIRMFSGSFAPPGWVLCSGQLLQIVQNTALYSLIGITYGGDGITTFALPDFRGRVPIHQGQGVGLSSYTVGEMGGSETVTLTAAQMPAHNHSVTADQSSSDTTLSNPRGSWLGATGATNIYSPINPPANPAMMNPGMIGVAGAGQAHPNMQPFLVVTFILSLNGMYPLPGRPR